MTHVSVFVFLAGGSFLFNNPAAEIAIIYSSGFVCNFVPSGVPTCPSFDL